MTPATPTKTSVAAVYSVRVNGKSFSVEVAEGGELSDVRPAASAAVQATPSANAGKALQAVLAGNIFKVLAAPGEEVAEGQPLLVVEAMKMETAVSAPKSGIVTEVYVNEGDVVAVGDPLVAIS